MVKCLFSNGPDNGHSCPKTCGVTSGCLSFEDHLVDSNFTSGEGTVHVLQMEHDEDTSTTQSTLTDMTSVIVFKQCTFKQATKLLYCTLLKLDYIALIIVN